MRLAPPAIARKCRVKERPCAPRGISCVNALTFSAVASATGLKPTSDATQHLVPRWLVNLVLSLWEGAADQRVLHGNAKSQKPIRPVVALSIQTVTQGPLLQDWPDRFPFQMMHRALQVQVSSTIARRPSPQPNTPSWSDRGYSVRKSAQIRRFVPIPDIGRRHGRSTRATEVSGPLTAMKRLFTRVRGS